MKRALLGSVALALLLCQCTSTLEGFSGGAEPDAGDAAASDAGATDGPTGADASTDGGATGFCASRPAPANGFCSDFDLDPFAADGPPNEVTGGGIVSPETMLFASSPRSMSASVPSIADSGTPGRARFCRTIKAASQVRLELKVRPSMIATDALFTFASIRFNSVNANTLYAEVGRNGDGSWTVGQNNGGPSAQSVDFAAPASDVWTPIVLEATVTGGSTSTTVSIRSRATVAGMQVADFAHDWPAPDADTAICIGITHCGQASSTTTMLLDDVFVESTPK